MMDKKPIRWIDWATVGLGVLVAVVLWASWPQPVDQWEPDPGYRWREQQVTFSFYNCPPQQDCVDVQRAIRESVAEWDAVSSLSFREVSRDGNIVFSFDSMYVGDGTLHHFAGSESIAWATYPCQQLVGDRCVGSSVVFSDSVSWRTTWWQLTPSRDMRSTALHEIGHALGLPHNGTPTSVMYPFADRSSRLSQGDQKRIVDMYGP
jgi:hypothetical protein